MIQRFAYLDKNQKLKDNQLNLLTVAIFERPLSQTQKKNQKILMMKQSAIKKKQEINLDETDTSQILKKLCLLDLTH